MGKLTNLKYPLKYTSTDYIAYTGLIPDCLPSGTSSCEPMDRSLTHLFQLVLEKYCEPEVNPLEVDISEFDIACLIEANPEIEIGEDLSLEDLLTYYKEHLCYIYERLCEECDSFLTNADLVCEVVKTPTEGEPTTEVTPICEILQDHQELIEDLYERIEEVEVPLITVNGIHGDGKSATPIKLGGALVEDTLINGAFNTTFSNTRFRIEKNGILCPPYGEPYFRVKGTINCETGDVSYKQNITGSAIDTKYIFNSNVDLTSLQSFIVGTSLASSIGGTADIESPPVGGIRSYGFANLFLGVGANQSLNSLDVDRVTNLFIDAFYQGSKPIEVGSVAIKEYIQLFIRKQNSSSLVDDIPQYNIATVDRFAIYQEVEADKNYFAGVTTFNEFVTFNNGHTASSDIRSKNILGTFDKGLNEVLKLDIIKYVKKEGFGDTEKLRIGLIAQDLEKVIPEAVHTGKDTRSGIEDFKSIDTDTLIFTMMNAIQTLSKKVDSLNTRISELEKQN